MDDFLPFAFFIVLWSLHNKKLGSLLIHNSWKTKIRLFQLLNHEEGNLKLQLLTKSGYYIVEGMYIMQDLILTLCLDLA